MIVAPGSLSSTPRGDERGGERAGHAAALLVDEEHAVGVTVEREPDVGAGLEHPGA